VVTYLKESKNNIQEKVKKLSRNECDKIEELNRFGKRKTFTCLNYQDTKHQKENNPEFSYIHYCEKCWRKFLIDKIYN
jgi:hypothetical protein